MKCIHGVSMRHDCPKCLSGEQERAPAELPKMAFKRPNPALAMAKELAKDDFVDAKNTAAFSKIADAALKGKP